MIEQDELRAELERAARRGEPPLTLDTDRVVSAGYRRLRRRQALRVTGAAAVAAVAIALPVLVINGPGGGVQAAGGGPSIEPTPCAPHGGCRGQTHSGSTDAYRAAQWLRTLLPTRQHYDTMSGWQVLYENDCVDGAKQDSITVGFRVTGHAGDIDFTLARNTPADRAPVPCQPDDAASAAPSGAPTIGGSAGSTPASPGAGKTTATRAAGYVRCETRPLPGGGKLIIGERHLPRGAPAGITVERKVAIWRPDGTLTTVVADNRVLDTPASADAPLTVDEMIAIAKNRNLDLYYPPTR